MGDGHVAVCGQLLSGRQAVAQSNILADTHQDDPRSGGTYRRTRLLARFIIGKLDRPAIVVAAVPERMPMLVPGAEELRELVLRPLPMACLGLLRKKVAVRE
jgi:hypothetical protein